MRQTGWQCHCEMPVRGMPDWPKLALQTADKQSPALRRTRRAILHILLRWRISSSWPESWVFPEIYKCNSVRIKHEWEPELRQFGHCILTIMAQQIWRNKG